MHVYGRVGGWQRVAGPEVDIGYLSFITLLLVLDTGSLTEPLVRLTILSRLTGS